MNELKQKSKKIDVEEAAEQLRKCPGCGEIRYSAYGGAWRCDVCGVTVGKEHDITERRETNAATGKFRR